MVLPSDSHVIGEIIIDGELYDPARPRFQFSISDFSADMDVSRR